MLKGELRSVISPANDVGELKSCCIRTEHKETCETKYINGFETSNTGSEQEQFQSRDLVEGGEDFLLNPKIEPPSHAMESGSRVTIASEFGCNLSTVV